MEGLRCPGGCQPMPPVTPSVPNKWVAVMSSPRQPLPTTAPRFSRWLIPNIPPGGRGHTTLGGGAALPLPHTPHPPRLHAQRKPRRRHEGGRRMQAPRGHPPQQQKPEIKGSQVQSQRCRHRPGRALSSILLARRAAGSGITTTQNLWDPNCGVCSLLWLLPGLRFHLLKENTCLAQTQPLALCRSALRGFSCLPASLCVPGGEGGCAPTAAS